MNQTSLSDWRGSLLAWTGLLAVIVFTLFAGLPAHAVEPLNLSDELVDQAGVIDDEAAVRAAQDRLADETDLQLFVVFVDSFDGLSGPDWTDQTAIESGLGTNDVLLAVAVRDRAYGTSVDTDAGMSEVQLAAVEADLIEPELREGDWGGAAVAAADGYRAAALQEPGAGAGRWLGIGAAALVVGGGAVWGGRKLMGRRREQAERDELATELGSAMVALDEALTASEGELAYAEAEFDRSLTEPFRQALEQSRTDAVTAYRQRTEIDLDDVADHAAVMAQLAEVMELVQAADQRLDEHAEKFAELRALSERAPQRIGELREMIAGSRKQLDNLEAMVAARTDLQPGQLEQVSELGNETATMLTNAGNSVDVAQEHVEKQTNEDAVMPIRVAEEALATAGSNIQMLGDLDGLVAEWAQQLAKAHESLSADLVDADRLASDDPAVTQLVTRARELLDLSGQPTTDPVDATVGLADIERKLDTALASYREAEEQARRARQRAESTVSRAQSQVNQLESLLAGSGGLATTARRSRANQARDLVAAAMALLDSDVAAAEDQADRALRLASDAVRSIEQARSARRLRHAGSRYGGSGWHWSGSSGSSWGSGGSYSSGSRSSSSRSSSRHSGGSSSRRSGGGRF